MLKSRGLWFAAGEIDPRVGGTIELQFRRANGEKGAFYKKRITRCEPPKVFAWNWDGGIDGPSEVTFELSQQQDKVLLVLTHRRHRKSLPGQHRLRLARAFGPPGQKSGRLSSGWRPA